MTRENSPVRYAPRAQALHWLSAALILAMIPLGFLMGGVESDGSKLALLRLHALVGGVLLLLTGLRAAWSRTDAAPASPPDLSPLHRRGMKQIHRLLYGIPIVLTLSGCALLVQSGIGAILTGLSADPLPADLDGFPARAAHGLLARLYIALLVAHIGGVFVHQLTKSDVLSRMGVRFPACGGQNAVRGRDAVPVRPRSADGS